MTGPLADADRLMEFAVSAARAAGDLTMRHFGTARVERKGDGSELTEADRASEAYLRERISEEFPEDAILGEEGTTVAGVSGRRWIIDPIDATRSFAAGVPLFGVLIALEVQGEPLLGCCHLPALGETLVAAVGAGAWVGGVPARASSVDSLEEARVVTSGLEYWRDWATAEGRSGFDALAGKVRFIRTWGDCYGYFLVATGRAEIMVDPAAGASWDYAPMVPILAEAGAGFTTISGSRVTAWSTALATNSHLHGAAVDCWPASLRDDRLLQTSEIFARHPG